MNNIQTMRKAKWHKFTDEERAEYRKAKSDRKKQLAAIEEYKRRNRI